MLFTVSQLFAHASDKSESVPLPSATLGSLKFAGQILNQAKQCINQALLQAVMESKSSGKIFSPQNWLKSGQAVNHEQLVAGTIVVVLKGMEVLTADLSIRSHSRRPNSCSAGQRNKKLSVVTRKNEQSRQIREVVHLEKATAAHVPRRRSINGKDSKLTAAQQDDEKSEVQPDAAHY